MKYWKAYTLALGFVLLVGAASTIPSQLWFRASGTGAALRKQSEKEGDIVSVKDYGATCDGSTDDTTAFTNAIASLPTTGGVVDARSCTSGVALTSLSISKNGVSILWPSANIALGTNSLTIPVGTHNVSLVGATTYGSDANSTVRGTFFTYTGTGAAIDVGDSTADTGGFMLSDITVRIASADTAAIGIRLSRATFYYLERPRVQGMIAANTQKDIDLEGATTFTGGTINSARIDNGNTGIYFGKNANANTLINPNIALQNTGTGLAFTGDVAGPLNGNAVLGGDIENCTTAVSFDYGNDNMVYGLRMENCTNAVTATANAARNQVFSNGQSVSMAISDSGSNNGFTDTSYAQFNRTKWHLRNNTDAATELRLTSGSSADQYASLVFNDRGTDKYSVRKNNDNTFSIVNLATINRLSFGASNSLINAESAGKVLLNADTNSGTGGTEFWSGGGSPAKVATIDSAGSYTTTSTKTKGTCTLNNASPSTCTATVVSGATCVCTNQTTQANAVKCSTATTTLTVTGPNTVTDVVAYICFG